MIKLYFMLFFIYSGCGSCGNLESKRKGHTSDGLTPKEQLAYIIAGECLQCDSLEMLDLGSVVLNRIEHEDFPDNVQDVIEQDNQFHGYCAEQYMYVPICYNIASYLLEGGQRNKEILFFYRNNQKKPKWIKKILIRRKYHNFGD